MKSYNVFLDSAHKRCELNTVSSSMISRYLLENGHKMTKDVQTADFIIINSCGYHQDLRDLSVALYKTYYTMKQPSAKIIMFGCLVKIDEDVLKPLDLLPVSFTDGSLLDELFFQTKKFDEITPRCDNEKTNVFIPIKDDQKLLRLPNLILSRFFIPFSREMKKNYARMIFGSQYRNKILVQISQGCLGNCSYCVIKKAKGDLRSRSIEAIIGDIQHLYDPSKTLFLVGDDCSSYGLDSGTTLFELLKEIHRRFPGLPVQISYIGPNFLVKFQDEYREIFQEMTIPYTTIPFQSGSNRIIRNMNRHYDVREVLDIIQELKRLSPGTYIEGHFIIGYPGETTVDFLKSLLTTRFFDYPVALVYSEGKGMKSALLPHKKSQMTKQVRRMLMILFINFVVLYKLATNP